MPPGRKPDMAALFRVPLKTRIETTMTKTANRGRKIAAGLGLAACLGFGAQYFYETYWLPSLVFISTDNAYVRGDIVAIAPKIAGYIVEVAVDDNRSVAAGDILFRIDDEDYAARHEQAAASLRAARAAKRSLAEERILQNALVAEAQAGLKAATAEATRADRDRERADSLVASGWVTKQRHDTAIAAEARARATVDQAKAGLAARKHRLTVIDSQSVRLDAAVEQAAAQLKLAEIALNDTVVRAPVSGRIGNLHAELGHYARPGVPLLSLVGTDHTWIVANFKEVQLERILPGQKVAVQVDTFGGKEFTGVIDSLAPASGAEFSLLPPDNATGNFVRVVQRIPVKITLSDTDVASGLLRPGMSARVEVDTRDGRKLRSAAVSQPPSS